VDISSYNDNFEKITLVEESRMFFSSGSLPSFDMMDTVFNIRGNRNDHYDLLLQNFTRLLSKTAS